MGITLSAIPSLDMLLDKLIDNSINYFRLTSSNTSVLSPLINDKGWISKLCRYLTENIGENSKSVQDSVSVRAMPQTIELLYDSVFQLKSHLEILFTRPSDNPLVFDKNNILSNASFITPILSLRIEGCINAILFMSWIVERRVHYLLSGQIEHISLNGSNANNQLGMVQVPKLISSILEEMRLNLGRRAYASGSSTSYGTEDAWSLTISLVEQLNIAIESANKILEIEQLIFKNLNNKDYDKFKTELLKVGKSDVIRKYYGEFKHLENIEAIK